jgi:hypothetical protein
LDTLKHSTLHLIVFKGENDISSLLLPELEKVHRHSSLKEFPISVEQVNDHLIMPSPLKSISKQYSMAQTSLQNIQEDDNASSSKELK